MAKKNNKQEVAEYIPDDKSRKWLIFPVAGALVLGTGVEQQKNSKEQENVNER